MSSSSGRFARRVQQVVARRWRRAMGRNGADRGIGLSAADDVYRVADRLLESLRQPVVIDRHTLRVTASIGFAVAVAGDTSASLLSRADKAFYLVKRRGRNGALRDDHAVEAFVQDQSERNSLTSAF